MHKEEVFKGDSKKLDYPVFVKEPVMSSSGKAKAPTIKTEVPLPAWALYP
jgi:formate-dependent phosphoribosylglycinamide formyltransferase (GAR transformylase)